MCRPNESTIIGDDEKVTATQSSSPDDRYYYLTPDARKHLKSYTYRGADLSLLYQHVLSPLAAFLVKTIIPKSMAPNTITSIGLLWMISAYMAYWWYAPGLEAEEPPSWIFLWNGIAILAYQTLDNMDGKQARRTGSSSPLGLLFDHGCDAINSIFGSANVIIGMNLNLSQNPLQIWILVFGPFFMFYIATWEHYFTGELILPIINGPSEGLLGAALLSFVSYFWGSDWWQQTTICEGLSEIMGVSAPLWKHSDLMCLAIGLGIFQEVIVKTVAVVQTYKGRAFCGILPFGILMLSFGIIGWIDPNVWLSLPRTSLHLAMVLFVDMSTDLMLSHVTEQPFQGFRWQLIPLLLLVAWAVHTEPSENFLLFIIAYTWAMGVYLLVKFVVTVREICETLEIWCFDIVTPYQIQSKE